MEHTAPDTNHDKHVDNYLHNDCDIHNLLALTPDHKNTKPVNDSLEVTSKASTVSNDCTKHCDQSDQNQPMPAKRRRKQKNFQKNKTPHSVKQCNHKNNPNHNHERDMDSLWTPIENSIR